MSLLKGSRWFPLSLVGQVQEVPEISAGVPGRCAWCVRDWVAHSQSCSALVTCSVCLSISNWTGAPLYAAYAVVFQNLG